MQSLSFAVICLPLLIGTALAWRGEWDLWADKTAERIALFGLLGASMIGAAAGARFYPHYYISCSRRSCSWRLPRMRQCGDKRCKRVGGCQDH